MTPEEKAWQQIGAQLTASGGSVQTKDEIHLSASREDAICELPFASGEPDCTLFRFQIQNFRRTGALLLPCLLSGQKELPN